MKKIYLMAALFAANFAQAQQGFETIATISTPESYWEGSDLTGASNGLGLFDSIFSDNVIEFNNQFDTTWGVASGYWSKGWAFSNQTSSSLTGLSGQFSSYTGGANAGVNYAVGLNNSEIIIADTNYAITSIMVTNSNYAGHSMLNGDFFAKQFGSPNDANGTPDGTNGEDWFLLTIVGYNAQGSVTDSVEFFLADYRFVNNAQDYIVNTWTNIDLSSLGVVSKLKFKLSSSDVGQWGMNTPAIFAIDDVVYQLVTSVNEVVASTIKVYPNPVNDYLTIEGTETINSIDIIDVSGKRVLSKKLTISKTQINFSDLPAGIYYLVVETASARQSTKLVKL